MDIIVEAGKCVGMTTELDEEYRAKAVILCTGTYLDSMIIIGDTMYSGAQTVCALLWGCPRI